MKNLLLVWISVLFITTVSAQSVSFWGITTAGGDWSKGSLYSINTDGTGFTINHNFQKPAGFYPIGGIIQSGVTGLLYGTCAAGGDSGSCTIWKTDLMTGQYDDIYSFGTVAGEQPAGGLVEDDDGMLYGATYSGGLHNAGVIYSIHPATGEYHDIYNLKETLIEPITTFLYHEGTLYWASSSGLFGYNIKTAKLMTLQRFNRFYRNFISSYSVKGNLVIAGDGKLYGIASRISTGSDQLDSLYNSYWDLYVNGYIYYSDLNSLFSGLDSIAVKSTLFSVNTATGQYSELHSTSSFVKGDLAYLHGCSVTLSADGKLYGTLSYDHDNPGGIIFSYDIAKDSYQSVYAFDPDGAATHPMSITEYNGQLTGIALYGTAPQYYSKLFSFDKTTGKVSILYTFNTILQGDEASPTLVNMSRESSKPTTVSTLTYAVYPNPASLSVSVIASADDLSEIVFYDLTGRIVNQTAFTRSAAVDVSNLAAGMYTYSIYTNEALTGKGKMVKL